MLKPELTLRIIVIDPPVGVTMRVQEGKWGLLKPATSDSSGMSFEFTVRLGNPDTSEPPNFLGDYVQGPRGGRFVYVNSGKLAGQADSCWERRAKISLQGITRSQVETLLASPGKILEASFAGTARNGSPACASVPLLDRGWRIVKR